MPIDDRPQSPQFSAQAISVDLLKGTLLAHHLHRSLTGGLTHAITGSLLAQRAEYVAFDAD
jgi:hypothetical protein